MREKAQEFLNDPQIAAWGGKDSEPMQRLAEAFDNVMSEGCSILLVGTGSTPAQYHDWPNLLKRVWDCEVSYMEVFLGNIERWKTGPYPLISGDVRDIDFVLKDKKFDVIFWSQGPEHIEEAQMSTTFNRMMNQANSGIICTCPWGGYYDDQEEVGGNGYEAHVQKSMDIHSFSQEIKENYIIRLAGEKNSPQGMIVILGEH
jgi:hypothetical protein